MATRMRTARCRWTAAASVLAILLSSGVARGQAPEEPTTGVLLLAHGGSKSWNDTVAAIAAEVDKTYPTEVAFGMASKPAIAAAIDRLAARHVGRIRAVPLFVSSHSSVITSTAYLLGLRPDAPKELAAFAKMDHGSNGGHGGHAGHAATADAAAPDLSPIASPVPITLGPALDDNQVVSDILADRAQSISQDPAKEVVVLVAHGPVAEDENARWLETMKHVADRISASGAYAAVEYQTVRDDAPAEIRDQATAELRGRVERISGEGRRVLLVPQLLSYGGIEKGIRKRLDGLEYTMPDAALAPDPRLAAWVIRSAQSE